MQVSVRVFKPKQTLLFVLFASLFLGLGGKSWGQSVIYSTNYGTANNAAVSTISGWSVSGSQSGNLILSTTSVSSGYTSPITASGSANLSDGVSGTTVGTAIATLAGQVNTTNYTTLQVAFGYRASSASYTGTVTFEWSADGITWNALTLPTLTRDGGWYAINGTSWLSLPAGAEGQSNLRFRFTFVRTTTGGNFRIDDFTVRGVSTVSAYYWNGGNNSVLNGTWDNSSNNWASSSTGTTLAPWPNSGTANAYFNNTNGGTVTLSGTITTIPTSTNIGTNGYTFITGTTDATLGGPVGLGANTLTISPATGNVAVTGAITSSTGSSLVLNSASTGNLNLSGGSNTSFIGNITATTTGSGSGKVRFDAATAVPSSGTLSVTNGGSMRLNAIATFGNANVTLQLNPTQTTIPAFDVNGISGTAVWAGPVTLLAASRIEAGTGDGLTLLGNVTGTGKFIKQGSGTVTLSGTNTNSGGVQIGNGTLVVNSGSSLGTGDVTFAQSNSTNTTAITLNNTSQTIGSLLSSFTATTGTYTQTFTLNGTALTINQTTGGTFGDGAVNTLTSSITGTGSIIKTGAAALTLSSANTYTGSTTITAGSIVLGKGNILPDPVGSAGAIIMNGGTLSTGANSGHDESVGTLKLTANSTIALGTGVHSLNFTASSGVAWTSARTLTITGWTGTAGSSGTAGKVFVGTASGGLTAAQLAQITFAGFSGTAVQLSTGEVVPSPATIAVSNTSLSGFTYAQGAGPSASQSFNVSGTNFSPASGNLTVSGSADYEVSSDNTTFGASVTISYTSGTLTATPVYVRLKAGLLTGTYNGETITVSGGGAATSATVTVSGTVTAAAFTINPTSIAFGTALVGASTAGTSVSVSNSGLSGAPGNVTITAPSTDFQVSTDNITYSASVTLPYTSSSFSGTFYVRFSPQTTGAKSGNVTITGGGAATGNVAVTGTGANAAITLGTITGSPFCASATVSVPFTYTPTVGYGGATFTAQLSSAAGSFTSPVNIGTIASDGSGTQTISATIPSGTAAGTGYKIRVISVNPTATSGSSAALTINTIPAQPSAITGATAVCSGSSQVYSVTSISGVTYNWIFPSGWTIVSGAGTASITVTPNATGGTVSVTPSNTCGNGTAQTLAVTASSPLAAAPVATAATTVYTTGFTANWNAVSSADGYYLDVYTKGAVSTTVTEGFNNGTTAPTGWTFTNIGGTYTTSGNYGASSPSLQFDASNDRVQTNTLSSPATQLSFWLKGQSASGGSFLVEGYNGSAWVTVQNFTTYPSTGTTYTYNATSSVVLPANLVQFRFTYTKSTGNLSFDDVALTTSSIGAVYVSGYQNLNVGNATSYAVAGLTASTNYYYVVRASNGCGATANSNEIAVTTAATCTSPVTIASFLPASGPANTLVSIRGTGMASATGVSFGGVAAASYTVQGDTTIIAEVPANAASEAINITTATCPASTASAFTLLSTSGTCGISGTASDLMISEIYDAEAGSLSYIEVFNGTTGDIALANYAVRITTGTSTSVDYPLSGTLASGSTYIVSVGSSPTTCPVTVNSANPTGGGFNGDDRVYLLKNSSIIDYVPNPNYGTGSTAPGFSQIRNATATGPSTTYIASEWTIYNTESCSNLGIAPFTPGASAITVASQPADVNCTSVVTFSVTTSGTGTGTNAVVWKYNDPVNQASWDNASTLNGVNGLTVSATTSGTTSTLTITGTTGFLYNYQFYAEVTRGSCVVNSHAAQYSYDTRPYYRTKTPITAGVWADASNWEMSTDKITYVNACQFPTSGNSISAEVMSGAKLTMNYSYVLKQLIVDAGGELATNATSSKLTILNGNLSGADFIVNGIFTDNASSSNSLVLNPSTWQLGANGTFIKTNTSSAAVYRDYYEGGMSTIPATANWIIRKSTASSVEFTTIGTTYPNLTFDNLTTTAFTFTSTAGSTSNMRVLGSLDVGGATASTGAATFVNNNTNASPMLVNGNMTVRAGSILTNAVSSGTPGTGFELKGNLAVNGTLTSNGGGTVGLFSFTGAAQQAVSGTGVINFNDVTVNSTAALNNGVLLNRNVTVGGALALTNGPLLINGNTLTLNGGVTRTSGSFTGSATSNLILNGSAAKALYFTLPGNVLHDVIVNATATDVTLSNALDITSGTSATGTSGTVTCNGTLKSNGNLTLKSDFYGTASVGTSGGSIQGNVTVERFTSAKASTGESRRAWRLFTSPVTGVDIHTAWQENGVNTNTFGTLITGEGFTAATAPSKGYDYVGYGNHASIRQYNSSINNWEILPANGNGTFVDVRSQPGFMLFIRGDRTVATPSVTSTANVRATGALLQGAQSTTIQTGSAFTLVGNPYASTIDFNSIYLNNSVRIQRKFYTWNSKLSTYGAYLLVDYNTSSGKYQVTPSPFTPNTGTENDDARYISANTAFFATPLSNTTTGNINIAEADKKPANQPSPAASPFREVPSNTKELLVNLNLKDSDTSATLADGFRVRFDDAFAGSEEENSSAKAWNFNENLNAARNGKSYIIEAQTDVKKADTLYMQMWRVEKRSYQLQVKAENFATAAGLHAWLEDSYLNTKEELALSGEITTVNFEVNDDTASSAASRFRIVLQNNNVLPVTLTKVAAQPVNGGVNVSWTVTNETNIKGYMVEKSTDGGRTFTAAGTQQAAKNNAQAAFTNYSAYDAQPKAGDNYYRIRIEAKDGRISYSDVVKVTIGINGSGIHITLYPNPVREGKANLQLTNLKEGTYLVSVYTAGGQMMYQRKITISYTGVTQSETLLLGNNVAQGSYQIRLADSEGNILYSDKLIVGR